MSADLRAARVTAFASLGVLSTTQDLVRAVLPSLTDAASPDLVAEETLALVATTTARAVEVGLRSEAGLVEAVATTVLETPFLYHDFLLGARLVAEGAEGDVEVDQSVYGRLGRKMEFYGVHFPVGRFPGPRALDDKLPLWMGRISPPKLPTTPGERLGDTGLVDLLAGHLRLVLAFAQREGGETAEG
ncbi:MAG: hypothetical protein ABJF88_08840 [Rhodothermales bacterium]